MLQLDNGFKAIELSIIISGIVRKKNNFTKKKRRRRKKRKGWRTKGIN